MTIATEGQRLPLLPDWVPQEARNYLVHTEMGLSIRELARAAGCHASTIMRQVHKLEARRDDPLVDEALSRLGRINHCENTPATDPKDIQTMTAHSQPADFAPTEAMIEREALRILRRLSEPGACLAVAADMEKAVVVRDTDDGKTARTAVTDRPIAEAMALKEWIACAATGRVARYRITQIGRATLRRLIAAEESARAGLGDEAEGDSRSDADARPRRIRYAAAESPVQALSRRRDKDGRPFLGPDLVHAAERLREDFELAQMGPRVTQNWDRFLTGADRGSYNPAAHERGSDAARARVASALAHLGPGLGDVALRCCCFLEGMEAAEKRMGWSARSGKIVLRIALEQLRRHYERQGGAPLIG